MAISFLERFELGLLSMANFLPRLFGPRALTEKSFLAEGVIGVALADDFEDRAATVCYLFHTEGGSFLLRLPPLAWAGMDSKLRVRVRGVRLAQEIFVDQEQGLEPLAGEGAGMAGGGTPIWA